MHEEEFGLEELRALSEDERREVRKELRTLADHARGPLPLLREWLLAVADRLSAPVDDPNLFTLPALRRGSLVELQDSPNQLFQAIFERAAATSRRDASSQAVKDFWHAVVLGSLADAREKPVFPEEN